MNPAFALRHGKWRTRNATRLSRASRFRGFTLIELLVVIGIIAIVTGLSAVALGGRAGDGAALAHGQTAIAALAGAARAQAALHHTRARLVIHAQPPPDGDGNQYLRALIVVREEPVGSGQFVAATDIVLLPAPVCVVPAAPVPANHLRAGVVWNNTPDAGSVSTLATATSFSYRVQAGGPVSRCFDVTGGARVYYIEFDAVGAIAGEMTADARIVLTTALLTNNALPVFTNASAIRGVLIRRSGVISLIGEPAGS